MHLEERLRRRLGRVDRREDGEGLVGDGHLVVEEDEPQREEQVDAQLLVHALRDPLRVRQLHGALDVHPGPGIQSESRLHFTGVNLRRIFY